MEQKQYEYIFNIYQENTKFGNLVKLTIKLIMLEIFIND